MTTQHLTQDQINALPPAVRAAVLKLQNDNAALLASSKAKVTMKVGAKGGLSVYGMGRWPVTLYKSQWFKLFAMVEDIKAFITANDSLLADEKDSAQETPAQ